MSEKEKRQRLEYVFQLLTYLKTILIFRSGDNRVWCKWHCHFGPCKVSTSVITLVFCFDCFFFSSFFLILRFHDCRQWLEDALKENDPTAVQLFLVGTKKDLSVCPLLFKVDLPADIYLVFTGVGGEFSLDLRQEPEAFVSWVKPQECFCCFTNPQSICYWGINDEDGDIFKTLLRWFAQWCLAYVYTWRCLNWFIKFLFHFSATVTNQR